MLSPGWYRFRRPASLDVQDWLWCIGDVVVSGGRGTESGIFVIEVIASSEMRPGAPYIMLMVGLEYARGKARGWSVPAFSQLMEIAAHQKQPGHSGWNDEEASLHPNSEGSYATVGGRGLQTERCVSMCKTINSTPHVARDTVSFLDQHDIEVIAWPAMSPDMNLIEHVCDQISIWVWDMDRSPFNPAESVHQAVCQAWRAVRARRVRTQVERMRAIPAARGGPWHTSCYPENI